MTIKDELKNTKKYTFLKYVEFLEMICRVAIMGIKVLETVEYKVHLMLKHIYDHFAIASKKPPQKYPDLDMWLANIEEKEKPKNETNGSAQKDGRDTEEPGLNFKFGSWNKIIIYTQNMNTKPFL